MANTIINIGRQFGSGGGYVAKEVGTLLGIPVYDNELISKAAEESGYSAELFRKNDEKKSLFSISNFFSTGRFVAAENYLGADMLFRIQSEVIRKTAMEGPAVFIGRCSDYILRDMDCLDVFICAPTEFRVDRLVKMEAMEEDEARRLIKLKDRTRESYYNYFTFGSWGTASNYDLCIDSSILGIEGTAKAIVSFLEKKVTARKKTTARG